MMTPAAVTPLEKMEVLSQDGKTMYLTVNVLEGSGTPVFTRWKANGENSWDTEVKGYTVAGYTLTVPAGETLRFQTVLSAEKDFQ